MAWKGWSPENVQAVKAPTLLIIGDSDIVRPEHTMQMFRLLGGGVPGDLYLDLDVHPDPHLRRTGDDVELDLPVSIAEAVLGAKVEVPTVEGPVTLTVPPGTSSGARLRLRGRGIKHPDGSRGDQIVRVEIVAPKIKPDDTETRKLFEQIAERTAKTPVRRF